MNRSIFRISLDVHDESSQTFLTVKARDTSHRLVITFKENGMPYKITEDCYAVFAAAKPDGTFLFNNCVIEGNKIIYDFTKQTVAAEGIENCEIVLYGAEGDVLTSPRFTMHVVKPVYNGENLEDSESSSEMTAIEDLATKATQALSQSNINTELIRRLMSVKLDKSGHTPNMFLGTDGDGNVVAVEAPSGGADKVFTDVGTGLGLEDGTVFVDPTYIDGKISAAVSSVYRFKGSVNNAVELDAVENPQVGDVYNVGSSGGTNLGMNYAWTGETWDALGATFTILDEITGSTTGEFGKAVSGYAVSQYVKKQMAGLSVGAGIYVGSGDMPEDCVVQIDPNGDVMDDSYIHGMIDKAIAAYNAEAMALLGEDEVTA